MEKELQAKRSEQQELEKSLLENKKEKRETEERIQKGLTRYAREIKTTLEVVNYDKSRFEPKVEECAEAPHLHLLNETDFEKCLADYRSRDKKPALGQVVASLTSVAKLKERAAILLERVVTASNPIPRLQEDPAIESWVNEGRDLHWGKDTCQFCGHPLPSDLLAQLAGHFSADYDDLMSALQALEKEVHSAKDEQVKRFHNADFYADLSERFAAADEILEDALRTRRAVLDVIAQAVTDKQTKAFTAILSPEVDDPTPQILSAIKVINEIVSEHNARSADFDRRRNEVQERLIRHFASRFIQEDDYSGQRRRITELRDTVSVHEPSLSRLESDILALERSVSDATKGAERINELLAAYFGKDEVRVTVSKEKRFEIRRGCAPAKNLSEGEKTAIAFAYFITRVQDGHVPLSDCRVVIDDPISSLDSNHLFNTYALIKTQMADCRQLFVLTHNFEFYNFVREWAEDFEREAKTKGEWKHWGLYLLKRTKYGGASLERIPSELLKFKSEYHFLFSKMFHFNKFGEDNFDESLSMANIVRRFMEAFVGVMIPSKKPLKHKLGRIFRDKVECERVLKFINTYSHNTTIMRSLALPDLSECSAVVDACLRAVREWNVVHYNVLVSEISET